MTRTAARHDHGCRRTVPPFALRRNRGPPAADTSGMGRPRTWVQINARTLDRAVYGPAVTALRHHRFPDTLLLHLKFVSRKHPRYRQQGMWAVVMGTDAVRRKIYRHKGINRPPTKWANAVMRLVADGSFARELANRRAIEAAYALELLEAIARRGGGRSPEEQKADRRLQMLLKEYTYRYGPLPPHSPHDSAGGASEWQPPTPVDHRKKRFRSIVNYHLPLGYDEMPDKSVLPRRWTWKGLARRTLRERRRRRRLWEQRHPAAARRDTTATPSPDAA